MTESNPSNSCVEFELGDAGLAHVREALPMGLSLGALIGDLWPLDDCAAWTCLPAAVPATRRNDFKSETSGRSYECLGDGCRHSRIRLLAPRTASEHGNPRGGAEANRPRRCPCLRCRVRRRGLRGRSTKCLSIVVRTRMMCGQVPARTITCLCMSGAWRDRNGPGPEHRRPAGSGIGRGGTTGRRPPSMAGHGWRDRRPRRPGLA